MNEGVVVGGWQFVIAAYAITAVVFVAYGIRLWTARPRKPQPATRNRNAHD